MSALPLMATVGTKRGVEIAVAGNDLPEFLQARHLLNKGN